MAYRNNYEDLLRDIQSSGQSWSTYDLELAKENPDAGRSIYTQKLAYANAQTDAERQAANDAAEMIRKQYGGYSAGPGGNGFTMVGGTANQKAPSYTQYASKYQSQIDELMAQLAGREAFSYNPTDDPSYAAYSEHYRNAGNQAREDVLAQAAAMVGGQPSSYAVAAAEQAQNAYNAQMSDMIPQLREAAYAMYADEGNNMRNDLSLLMALDEAAYNKHQNDYANQMAEWQANYGVSRDAIEDARAATSQTSKSGSGGGGGGGGPVYVEGAQDEYGLYAAAIKTGNPANYIASNYKKFGFTSATGLQDGYKNWESSQITSAVNYASQLISVNGRDASFLYNALSKKGYADSIIDAAFVKLGL